ncbi:MAG: hypothetical protein AMXMBFR55_13740 [Gemmatimonadota bacterium]|jgi:hypothetical protein
MHADLQKTVGLDPCPVCGSPNVQEIRCKVICLNCRTILQSCADLGGMEQQA